MRFMVIVKANEDSEKGVLPTEPELAEMGAYNEELVKAGVMLAGEGLLPELEGRPRPVRRGRQQRRSIDGPFAETKELVAGFWILEVSSREEVLEWVKKAPVPGRRGRGPAGRQRRGLRRRDDPRAARAGGPAAGHRRGAARRLTLELLRRRRRRDAPRRRRRLADGVGAS